jgi:hypothetical protein
LEESGVLAPVLRFAREQEIVLTDGGGAESVCFNDVRAGFQILGMDLFDDLRLGELEQLEIALEMFRRMRREARPSVLFLGEFVPLHHRPHRAIEQDDALAEKGFERMNGCSVHGELAINDKVPDSATNKLTYHDASIRLFFPGTRARNRSPERTSTA